MTSDQNRTGVPPLSADSGVRTPDVYLADPDVTLYHGDALETLRGMPDESVHCVVTSPPYWGLRDYGTGLWEKAPCLFPLPDGRRCAECETCQPNCDHTYTVRAHAAGCAGCGVPMEMGTPGCQLCTDRHRKRERRGTPKERNYAERAPTKAHGESAELAARAYRDVCGKCGAHRTDNQLGLEPTPELYVQNMVTVFRELRRVLRRDGTCWLNIGDSYNANQGAGFNAQVRQDHANRHTVMPRTGFKAKDLVGIPWMLAFALRDDGWWLRADIIWAKPNPMPESVTDRPTKAHEYVFLLTRSPRYFFDQEAVREPHQDKQGLERFATSGGSTNGYEPEHQGWVDGGGFAMKPGGRDYNPAGRNVRSVWEIATEPFPQAHFATFPTELARRCILAGTSERGCCPECGAPWAREVEHGAVTSTGGSASGARASNMATVSPLGQDPERSAYNTGMFVAREKLTLGWRPTCECAFREADVGPRSSSLTAASASPSVPCTVLDPFAGACTVPHVARRHGRHSIGIELSETYLREIALPRLQQLSLLA